MPRPRSSAGGPSSSTCGPAATASARSTPPSAPAPPPGLPADPAAALTKADKDDVPLLFWTASSWGAAIAAGSDRPDLVVDWPAARALLEKALQLDRDWDRGSLHEAMVLVEGLPEAMGGSQERAWQHWQRALELSRGERASTYVTWASAVSLRKQDRVEFLDLLEQSPRDRPRQGAGRTAGQPRCSSSGRALPAGAGGRAFPQPDRPRRPSPAPPAT